MQTPLYKLKRRRTLKALNSLNLAQLDTNTDIEVWTFEHGSFFFAIGWKGREGKPSFRCKFTTEEDRTMYINDFEEERRRIEKTKRRLFNGDSQVVSLSVGDILVGYYSFEQTNVVFFQVVQLRGKKTVYLRRIRQSFIETGFMVGETVPLKDEFYDDTPPLRRVYKNNQVKIDQYMSASNWLGTPIRHSNYG